MQITLNGEPYTHDTVSSVQSLLDALEIRDRRVAVMVNEVVIKKDSFTRSALQEGDQVEIIQMVGGG